MLLAVFILSVFAFIYGVTTMILRLFRTNNPYIKYHKKVHENDKNYDKYLKWLRKKGGDLPLHKVKSEEEKEFDKHLV